jgi:hypothetical protein
VWTLEEPLRRIEQDTLVLRSGEGFLVDGDWQVEDGPSVAVPALLDLATLPTGLFRAAEDPNADLELEATGDGVMVTVKLVRGTSLSGDDGFVARLVDASEHRVLAQGALSGSAGLARATLNLTMSREHPDRDLWVEVVRGTNERVEGALWHEERKALRWGQAALRAERLRLEGWRLAAAGNWARCGDAWALAEDDERAFLGHWRAFILDRKRSQPAPSGTPWADTLAQIKMDADEPFQSEPFLAEAAERDAPA